MKHHLLRGYNISSVRLKISVIASPVIIGMYVATVGKDHTINEIYWVAGGGTARLRTR